MNEQGGLVVCLGRILRRVKPAQVFDLVVEEYLGDPSFRPLIKMNTLKTRFIMFPDHHVSLVFSARAYSQVFSSII